MTLTIPADDLRRLLDERDHLREQVTSLQTTCTRLEREARIGRARAEYWRGEYYAYYWNTERKDHERAGSEHSAAIAYGGFLEAKECRDAAERALASYGVDIDGEPLP